jgi:hypothetical protein
MPFKKLRYARAALLATTMALAAPAAASAAGCPSAFELSKPFAHLGDTNDYFVAPGGDFEPGTPSWKTSEDVSYLTGGVDLFGGTRAIEIESGDKAQSPRFCVDGTFTHLRFHLYSPTGTGSMRVEATVGRDATDLGTVSGAGYREWGTTPFIPLAGPLGLKAASESIDEVRLRFTAIGDMQMDLVAVDPYRK